MEGDSAAVAIFGTQIERLKKEGKEPDAEMLAEMDEVRETYDKELDAKYAAARGFVDAIVTPENLRDALKIALETTLEYRQTASRRVCFAGKFGLRNFFRFSFVKIFAQFNEGEI